MAGAARVALTGEPAGVRDSGGGGVSSSISGRSGSTDALSLGDMTLPFVLGSEIGLPCTAMGVEGAESPRMMLSSTSRFLISIPFFRLAKVSFWASSLAKVARFVSIMPSNPAMRPRRALMLSETAPSALARLLSSALRRAAWTGGVGVGLLGSVSLSYSESAVGTALRVVAAALETAICRGTRGSISEGAEGPDEPENREPPSKGFLLEERVLSSSVNILAVSHFEEGLQLTVYASFDSFLYRGFKYQPLPPHLNYAS